MHVKAWKRLIALRSPDHCKLRVRTHLLAISDHVIQSMRNHCWMVASSDTPPLFRQVSPQLRARFEVIRPCDNCFIGCLFALDQLINFDFKSNDILPRLREINVEIFAAKVPDGLCDRKMTHCLYQVHNTVCTLVGRFFADPRITSRLEFAPAMADVLKLHLEKIYALALRDFEILIGTTYQEIAFWSLWTVSATLHSWNGRTLEVLRQYVRALKIKSFREAEDILISYAYFPDYSGSASKALYADICEVS